MERGKACVFLCLLCVLVCGLTVEATACSSGRDRHIALLDLNARNGDSDANTFSLQHALNVAGLPYIVTTSVEEAVKHIMVVSSALLRSATLLPTEEAILIDYVSAGGIFVAPQVSASGLYPLFGICKSKYADTRHELTWNTASGDGSLRWFDDPGEKTIRLGRATCAQVIGTRGYGLQGATALATFDDGWAAVTRNRFGEGYAFALGYLFRDLILRNQLNKDYNAQKTYSNGFEPASDTVMLFLRGIYESLVQCPVWKHTSPCQSRAVLMIIHDVDSTSAMNMMNDFAVMENARSLSCTYNITTHYFRDKRAKDYYTPNVSKIAALLEKNQKIGSHSVGHFPDWDDTTVFPEGSPGNTRDTYHPYYDGATTVGGTVYGEFEVSKKVLEEDLGVTVQTAYSSFLRWNKKQVNVLDALGYKNDSSLSANDVLTNFPFRCRYDTSFNGKISNIYEIPMTLSDMKISAANYEDYAANWLDVINRNTANGAATLLLIHPNRDFKLAAEERVLDGLPEGVAVMDVDSFGDYWRKREAFDFSTDFENGLLIVTIPDSLFPIDQRLGVIVKDKKAACHIIVQTSKGRRVRYSSANWQGSGLILYSFRKALW